MNKLNIFLTIFIISIFFLGKISFAKPVFVVTINPVEYILSEIVGNKGDIIRLVPSGASPHTYSPKPSQVYKSRNSQAMLYVSNNLDSWVKSIPANNKIELLKLLPNKYKLWYNKSKGIIDPHFWTDPMAVRALLPNLVKILIEINPANKAYYKQKSKIFSDKLLKLNNKISTMLKDLKREHIFLFHPSFRYFLKRYGLSYSGSIEEIPGNEPTPKDIQKLVKKIKVTGAKAIFSEPQLPKRPAKIIAEACNLKIYYLDPLGNNMIENYKDLILSNTRVLIKALRKK